jgi:hypothetical protein
LVVLRVSNNACCAGPGFKALAVMFFSVYLSCFSDVLMRSRYGKAMSMELGSNRLAEAKKNGGNGAEVYNLEIFLRSNSADKISKKNKQLLVNSINK